MSSSYELTALDQGQEARLSPRTSVGDEVYDLLLSQLISLRIAPGARIPVDKVARDLGVSQTPVRAALIRLESEGLVAKTHLIGYSAAPLPSASRFVEIYQIRLLLEPFAARESARMAKADVLQELDRLHYAMSHHDAGDAPLAYGKFAKWDDKFHQTIAIAGAGELLADTLAKLHTHVHLFRVLFHSRVTEEAIKEHAEILEAIRSGNERLAAESMDRHVRNSFRRISPILESLSGTPSAKLELR